MTEESTYGLLNYMDDSVQPSLYRNGKVRTDRNPEGNDSGTTGLVLKEQKMTIANARVFDGDRRMTLGKNGFELLDAPLQDDSINFFDHDAVVRDYYGQCTQLVTDATGARAYAFDHNIRSATGKHAQQRSVGGQEVQEPLHMIHGDYTLFSAPQRLRDLANRPTANDTYRESLGSDQTLIDPADAERALEAGRFAIINVWRNIVETPVTTHPLALCDGQTVSPQDLVVFEIHYRDRVGENYFTRYSDDHGWYYYPEMTRSEALLIKQWDSAGGLARSDGQTPDATDPQAPCTFSCHSAFDDLSAPDDAPDRWSIEVRCMVIYD